RSEHRVGSTVCRVRCVSGRVDSAAPGGGEGHCDRDSAGRRAELGLKERRGRPSVSGGPSSSSKYREEGYLSGDDREGTSKPPESTPLCLARPRPLSPPDGRCRGGNEGRMAQQTDRAD